MHTPHPMQVELYLTGQNQLSWSQTTREETYKENGIGGPSDVAPQ